MSGELGCLSLRFVGLYRHTDRGDRETMTSPSPCAAFVATRPCGFAPDCPRSLATFCRPSEIEADNQLTMNFYSLR